MLNKLSRAEAEKNSEQLLKKAGFTTLTPLQQKLLPVLFQGRDIFVETEGTRGKTASICISAALRPAFEHGKTRALIVTSNQNEIDRLNKRFHSFSLKNRSIAPLGIEKNPKKELKFIGQKPDIIIGTTERIIDHLRRDNIDLSTVELLIVSVNSAEGQEGLHQDLLFILSKMESIQQKIIFSIPREADSSLTELLQRPNILTVTEKTTAGRSHIAYTVEDLKDKPESLRTLYFMDKLDNALVITRNNTQAQSIEKRFKNKGIPCTVILDPKEAGTKKSGLFCSSLKTAESMHKLPYQTIVFFHIPPTTQLYVKLAERVTGSGEETSIISLLSSKEHTFLELMKEEQKVEIKESGLPEQTEAMTQKRIDEIIKLIKEEENPEVLDTYKKIYKKQVPFSLRRYFTAYLLKNCIQGGTEEKSFTTLFVSVGKNRKVYPKDLSRLFSGALKIEPTHIGHIKVLESYSFVDIPADKAERAIETLNGSEFRGRKMTVNFARKKEEK